MVKVRAHQIDAEESMSKVCRVRGVREAEGHTNEDMQQQHHIGNKHADEWAKAAAARAQPSAAEARSLPSIVLLPRSSFGM